ncbi:hypothetical protein [Bradyrhizobium sp.]
MADSDIDGLAKIILGETSGLTASDIAVATASQDRLWSVVAFIAQSARTKGLLGQMRRAGNMVPDDETASYLLMKDVADKISQNRYGGPTPLPKQAVLWQLTGDGYLSFQAGKPPAWIFAGGVTVGGQFKDRNGLLYRLYESPNEPDPGQTGFVSSYSSTGLAPPAWSVPAKPRKVAWGLGSFAAILFLLGGVSAIRSGQSDGTPRAEVRAIDAQYRIVDKLADNCIADATQFPNWKRSICGFLADASGKYAKPTPAAAAPQPGSTQAPAAPVTLYGLKVGQTIASIMKCLNLGVGPEAVETKAPPPADADTAAADDKASCNLVARSATDAGIVGVAPPKSFLDRLAYSLMGLRTTPNTRSILVQLLLITVGIAGLAVALGLGTKGSITGIWIDERNRVSLARAQVTLWTIVALGGFAAIALYNVGLAGPVAFPQIPASIAAALGIAFASPMISALILNSKTFGAPDSSSAQANSLRINVSDYGLDTPSDLLETRAVPSEASLADVFVGEHVSDAGNVDLSRLQNVVLTVTLVLGYFAMLVGQLGSIAADTLLTGISALPDPGAAFTSVLLVSHATYLGTKAYNGSGKPADAH